MHATRPADALSVDTRPRSPSADLWTRTRSRDRRQRLLLGGNERAAEAARRAPRRVARTWTEVGREVRARAAALVSTRATLAHWLRRAHQGAETSPWYATLSLSWRSGHPMMSRSWCHRRQSDQCRDVLGPASRGVAGIERAERNEADGRLTPSPPPVNCRPWRSFLHREVGLTIRSSITSLTSLNFLVEISLDIFSRGGGTIPPSSKSGGLAASDDRPELAQDGGHST